MVTHLNADAANAILTKDDNNSNTSSWSHDWNETPSGLKNNVEAEKEFLWSELFSHEFWFNNMKYFELKSWIKK